MILIKAKKSQIFGVKAIMPNGILRARLKRFKNSKKLRKSIAFANKDAATKY